MHYYKALTEYFSAINYPLYLNTQYTGIHQISCTGTSQASQNSVKKFTTPSCFISCLTPLEQQMQSMGRCFVMLMKNFMCTKKKIYTQMVTPTHFLSEPFLSKMRERERKQKPVTPSEPLLMVAQLVWNCITLENAIFYTSTCQS